MNNNSKFNLTHPLFSKQIIPHSNLQPQEGRYHKTSTFFRKRSNSNHYDFDNQSGFRIESYSSSKTTHRQLMLNMNSKSFKITHLGIKQKLQQNPKQTKLSSSTQRQNRSINKISKAIDTKIYWQRYLNEQISHGDLTKQLNKNIVSQSFRGRSQSQIKNLPNNIGVDKNRIEKSAFYVNNFLRKRKNYLKYKQQQQKLLRKMDEIKINDVDTKNNDQTKPKSKKMSMNKVNRMSNQHIVPWQKIQQGFEDAFNIIQY